MEKIKNKKYKLMEIKLSCCFHRNIINNICEDCRRKLSYCCNEEIIQDENPIDDVFKCSKCKKIQNSPEETLAITLKNIEDIDHPGIYIGYLKNFVKKLQEEINKTEKMFFDKNKKHLKTEIENFKEELLQIVIEDVPWRFQDRLFEKLKGKELYGHKKI